MRPLLALTFCVFLAGPAVAVDVADFSNHEILAGMLEPTEEQKGKFAPWETSFFVDENGDDKFTITEFFSWFADAFYFPGSTIVWLLWGTGVGTFFEITPLSFQSGGTGFLALLCWLTIFAGAAGKLD